MKGYVLKISLDDTNDETMRKIKVNSFIDFDNLHDIIQIVFDLSDLGYYDFVFDNNHYLVVGSGYDLDYYDAEGYHVINYFEKINDFLSSGLVFSYHYNTDDEWSFIIEVEQVIDDAKLYPEVIDYCGNNLEEYLNEDNDVDSLVFDLEDVNDSLSMLEIDLYIGLTPLKNDYSLLLEELQIIISKRKIDGYEVIKVNGKNEGYWVIAKSNDGYLLELFTSDDEFINGFYNLNRGIINSAFCCCYTFVINEGFFNDSIAIDDNGCFAAFINCPGYLPTLLTESVGISIISYCNDLVNALKDDNNSCEEEEYIEITLEGNEVIDNHIAVLEPKIDLDRYNYGYYGDKDIDISRDSGNAYSVDVACVPCQETAYDGRLDVYAIIASEDDYLIKMIDDVSLPVIGEVLIDLIINFTNRHGLPDSIVASNINIYYLIRAFVDRYGIECIVGNNMIDIEAAIIDAFGLGDVMDEMIDDPLVQEVFNNLDDYSDEEVEARLDEIFDSKRKLN